MRITNVHSGLLAAGIAGFLLSGCGGSDGSATASASFTDIAVERGPLLHASVGDANGNYGNPIGNGVYRFNGAVAYPVRSVGGYIDTNRNGVVDEGDVKAGNVTMTSGDSGTVVTLCSTLASRDTLRTRLLALGFTETQLLNNTPTQDRMIAALSDEVYKYAVSQGISDVAGLTTAQLDGLTAAIQNRITAYQSGTATAAQREQQLMTELAAHVDVIDSTEAQVLAGMSDGQLLVNSLPAATLNDAQKQLLVFMWNEEKLAKDVYLALNQIYPSQQLSTIATQSEARHQEMVRALLEKYNLSVWEPLNASSGYTDAAVSAVAPGAYTVTAVQTLYNTLYAKGIASARDSMEVGCMVEVTDVNDLTRDLPVVSSLLDATAVFENLRAGSYNHYWAFDRGLKAIGVADGCCSLGAGYCHLEYPTSSPGQ
jgi:hypothetical protein